MAGSGSLFRGKLSSQPPSSAATSSEQSTPSPTLKTKARQTAPQTVLNITKVMGKLQKIKQNKKLTFKNLKEQEPRIYNYILEHIYSGKDSAFKNYYDNIITSAVSLKTSSVKPRHVHFTISSTRKKLGFARSGTPVQNQKPTFPPVAVPTVNSITTRYKQLKEKLKAIQNLAGNRSRRSENNARELRRMIQNQQRNLMSQIRQRNMYTRSRYPGLAGNATNYYSPNSFSRYYRAPQVQRGLERFYYHGSNGIPRYVQQLPLRVWHINQGGRTLPPVPFFTRRRR